MTFSLTLPASYPAHMMCSIIVFVSSLFSDAFFIVELLNSLVRDGIISYSPKQCQYTWSRDAIDLIQTGESVAELIASNISSMPEKSQRVLRILSCFGIQTDLPLLQVLEVFEEGMTSQIDEFIDQGILDRAGK